jgi:hypothetical protein
VKTGKWRFAALLLLLQACASTEEPARTAPEPGPVVKLPSAVTPEPSPRVFCDQLEEIIKARFSDYQSLEGSALDSRTAEARLVPEGFRRCEIQGGRAATARYVCRGQPLLHRLNENDEIAAAPFNAMAGRISACLDDRRWPEGKWFANDVMIFGDDERQQIWHDLGKGIRQKLALKIERDYRKDLVYLRLEVAPR